MTREPADRAARQAAADHAMMREQLEALVLRVAQLAADNHRLRRENHALRQAAGKPGAALVQDAQIFGILAQSLDEETRVRLRSEIDLYIAAVEDALRLARRTQD